MLVPKQLIWRCRRGVRELDVLLDRYLKAQYLQLNTVQKEAFERLLEEQDPLIMDWLFMKSHPKDKGILFIINQLRDLSGLNS
jgi:antitoxin CptB